MSALIIRTGPCVCAVPGCEREWPRDPMLEVPCPDCHAGIGIRCSRPSGHSGPFVPGHAARDLAAAAAGAYGPCPLGRCGSDVISTRMASNSQPSKPAAAPSPAAVQGAFSF